MSKQKKDTSLPSPLIETWPQAFLNNAHNYCNAGNILLNTCSNKHQCTFDPIYLLYFHSIELTLKAYLRYRGIKTSELRSKKYGHNLFTLYSKCVEEGFVYPDDNELHNIVQLLDSGNEGMAFRYWNPKNLTTASIEWVSKVSNKLIETMESHIPKSPPGKAVKVTSIISIEKRI